MRLQFLLYRCAQYRKMLKTNALFCFRLWKSDCCFLNHPESISMNSLFSSPTTQTYFPNTYIFIHSFIHSFIHQTLRGASLCDYFKWKCCKYKPYHYLSEGQCLHILHLCLSPYCWQPKKKIQLYFTYLFSCHLWQIFNLLLNDIYDFELACFCVPNMHWGPACIDNMCVCLSKCPWEMK